MKLATFNVNSIRARLEIVLAWLEQNKPDILCLQETKTVDAGFPESEIKAVGYDAIFRGEKSYNGVAVLSKRPADEARYGLDDGDKPDEARLIAARFGKIWIVNTYVPQGREIDHPMYQYKLEWFRRLKSHFNRHFTPKTKLAWVGDLNIAPEAKDIHNAEQQADHVCFHVDARRAFEDVKAWGFEDVFRKYHPESGQYTFFDYRMPESVKRGLGWRVDHILATRPLAAKCTDSYVDLKPRLAARPSDHTFLVAEFDLDG